VSFLEKAPPEDADGPAPGVLVPAAAIARRGDAPVAFVVTDRDGDRATVARRSLELGRTLGSDREVSSGLAGGETVVLDAPPALEDGAEVRIASTQD